MRGGCTGGIGTTTDPAYALIGRSGTNGRGGGIGGKPPVGGILPMGPGADDCGSGTERKTELCDGGAGIDGNEVKVLVGGVGT